MGARVTGTEVKQIIDTSLDASVIEYQFIATANTLVTEQLASKGLSDAILAKIELYLSAHFLAITEERGAILLEKVGDSSQMVANVYAKGGLLMTRYGQTAIALDTSGTLRNFDSAKKALFRLISPIPTDTDSML